MTPNELAGRLRLPSQPLLRHLVLGAAGLVAIWVITSTQNAYNDFQIASIGAYLVAIAGLSILTGFNGQISLGHGAFMMVGAYTTALLAVHTHLLLAVVLLASVAVAAAAGGLVGVAAARLRGPYLAGATLALAVALPDIPVRWSATLKGRTGFSLNPPAPPAFLGPTFTAERWMSWISGLAVVLTVILLANLARSRFGRSFRAVRDDEIAASLAGIHVARTQVLAFVLSAGCAGLGGALLAYATTSVSSDGFPINLSIALLTGAVLGGMGTLFGAVWGAILVVYLPQWATSLSQHLSLSRPISANLALGVYGLVLMVAILVFPGGIQAGLRRLVAFVATRGSPVRST
ncbi:MAG TPA: branched-chain amino acid ABC transporter permease [Mycobacteriales bacterium]|nr:branched-chain amino acid ABC transporter permease [Mycobacteriales bacterium]